MIAAWYTRERNGGVARSSAFGRRSSRTSATLNNQPVTQLTYDQIGNRITCNNTHYRPNACNQYEDLSYDSDGNMTMYDGWALTWNGENRLIRMIKGSAKLEFAYDYMGRRYEKKVYANDVLTKHQRFIYDGYKLIEIRNALNNDALTHSFVWRKVPQDVPYSMKYGNTTYYYITDANKNVVCLLSNSIDAEYQYGPWGEIREIEGTAAYWNPFRFSSEFYDDETGLVYYNYRYYSPALGRWLSRDPIGEEGGMNIYAMGGNNIIQYIDYLGLNGYNMLVDIFNAPENPSWHAAMRAIDDNCCYGIPFDKTRQCCIEGEGVYGEQESWIVKICHGNMDLGPFGHVWIESGKIKKGFTSALDTGIFSVWLDSGKFEDDSYSSREESHEFYSYWFDKNKKYCYPFYLKKCHFDIEKFNSCLEEERPKALYSFMGYPITVIGPAIIINFPNFINEAIIGAYLAIYLPKNIDKLSDNFNNSPIMNCYSAAYHMLAKCAKKAKR